MAEGEDKTPEEAPDTQAERDAQESATAPQEETKAAVEDFAESFKSAAQKVLEERFGMEQKADGSVDFTKIDGERVKENAQTLITGLMSQLAGLSADATKPTPPPEAPVPATTDDNVIDLESARRAREPREPSALETRMSENLKATFNAYVQDNLVPQGSSGQVKLDVDGEMLRDHGPQMLTALFGAFTKSLFPEGGVEVDLPSGHAEAKEEEGQALDAEGEESEAEPSVGEGPVEVKLNVDVAGLFQSLLGSIAPKK